MHLNVASLAKLDSTTRWIIFPRPISEPGTCDKRPALPSCLPCLFVCLFACVNFMDVIIGIPSQDFATAPLDFDTVRSGQ